MRTGFRDDEVRMIARSGGMKQMQEDALQKVKAGITTLDEVLRVVPFEQASGLRCDHCHKTIATNFVFCPYCGTAAGTHPIPAPRKELARSGGVS
jgi:rRNA maturation endonuclease Nob1